MIKKETEIQINPFLIKRNIGDLIIHTTNLHDPGTICGIVNLIFLISIVGKFLKSG